VRMSADAGSISARSICAKSISAKRRRDQSGSALVEFGLVLLPLFALLFLIMDVGWILFSWAAIQEGAREGVRYAITGSGQAEATLDAATKLVVEQYSFGAAKAGNISVDYYPSTGYSSSGAPASLDGAAGSTTSGNLVKVTIQGVSVKSFVPLFDITGTIQLSASACDILQ
jgi:Flp pilus assembly protein TadG